MWTIYHLYYQIDIILTKVFMKLNKMFVKHYAPASTQLQIDFKVTCNSQYLVTDLSVNGNNYISWGYILI